MKISLKDSANHLWFTVPLMLAVFAAGCVNKPGRNPLEGWKGGQTASEGRPFGAAIVDDYQDYIRNLPAKERSRVDDFNIRFYENAAGLRAVEITIPINRTHWKHVLFYDKSGKQIKAMKYAASRYLS